MSKEKFIKAGNLPPNLHLGSLAFWFMFISYYDLPDWVLGVWGTYALFMVFAFAYRFYSQEGVDIFEEIKK